MNTFVTTSGKILKVTKEVKSRISGFVIFKSTGELFFCTKKLSDLYTSRSTNYASIYNNAELFIINKNQSDIVAAGYSKLCKAIISLNLNNHVVKAVIEELKAENEAKVAAEKKANDLFLQQVEEAKQWIAANDQIVEKEAKKVCEKFGREFTTVSAMSSKMQQQLAWFLLKNFTNNTKTAIFHAL